MLVFDNRFAEIRRQLMTEVLKCFFEDNLSDLDRIPNRLYPKHQTPYRCCIHKDRILTRQRILAILGFEIEKYEEETDFLAEAAQKALLRNKVTEPVLTVIDEACSTCVKTNYFVTDACRGCLARPCVVNCPKQAIQIANDKASIDHTKCVNCGICQKVCPYNAIVYIPVPCEEGCPTGAISKDEYGKETIDYDKCIYCGKCTRNCPFGAIVEKSQVLDVAKHLKAKDKITALVAPSIVGQFTDDLNKITGALKKLGFSQVLEVASGADTTAHKEAKEVLDNVAKNQGMMGTSCCPAYTEAVKKYAQSFAPFVSSARTPLHYTAIEAKKQFPKDLTVFIGPCIAKKFEGIHDPEVDLILTYEELHSLFAALGIDPDQSKPIKPDNLPASNQGRAFPLAGKVKEAVLHYAQNPDLQAVQINGLTKKGIRQLKKYGDKPLPGHLIEVMSCEGGCMFGPGVLNQPEKSKKILEQSLEQD
ncbi:MAG TPA: 4Fe-4S dicluster domain-containing protein [Candidatus Wirthbacteria bacterium]|nr:4Fe-4S dicluster domain-containing protein [Candidatus Wirthbacteria bacterium]